MLYTASRPVPKQLWITHLMKINLKQIITRSLALYVVLLTSTILLSLWVHEHLLLTFEHQHKRFYLVSLAVQGLLTAAYWFAVFQFYTQQIKRQNKDTHLILDRYQLAVEASQEAVWDWSLNDKQEVFFSEAYCANLGFTQAEFGNTQHAWRERLTPEARDNIYQDVLRFIAEGDGIYEKSYRMLHRDNSQRLIRSRGCLIKNDQGKPVRFIGIARDVTEQQATKERLKQAEAVFETTREAVLITNSDNRIVYINPSFTRITGYHEAEIAGKTPNHFKSGRHSSEFYQSMWSDLNNLGLWSGEVWNCRKNGELLRQYQTIRVIKDESGCISHYVAVFSDISTLDDSVSELSFLSLYDPLTGLANRSHLHERLKISLAKATQTQVEHTFFLVGLDHFKSINESLGHKLGDELLQEVTQRIQGVTPLSSVLARVGGDEFALICEEANTPKDAANIARKITTACKAPFTLAGNQVFVSASVGICPFPTFGTSVEVIMRNADSALHKAKNSGRDTFAFYSSELTEQAYQRILIASELRQAIENNTLELHYQPIFALKDLRLIGCEALVRWNHPKLGFIPPNDFIPIAEESALVNSLDAWVLQQACTQMHTWLTAQTKLELIAVNLSSRSLSSSSLAKNVATTLAQTHLDARFLELEVTESAVMEDPEHADATLSELRDVGVRIAIDDFGTGFSSLARLKSLPVHKLKIDQCFIEHVTSDSDDAAIVKAIIALGKSMGLQVQAEGIEYDEQTAFLQQEHCELGQGYLLGRPLTADNFTALALQASTTRNTQTVLDLTGK